MAEDRLDIRNTRRVCSGAGTAGRNVIDFSDPYAGDVDDLGPDGQTMAHRFEGRPLPDGAGGTTENWNLIAWFHGSDAISGESVYSFLQNELRLGDER